MCGISPVLGSASRSACLAVFFYYTEWLDLNVSFIPLSSNRERPHLPRTNPSQCCRNPRELMKGCCRLFSFSLKRGGTWLQYTFGHRFTVPAPGRLPALAPLAAAGGRLPPPSRFPRPTLGPQGQRHRRNSHGRCHGAPGPPSVDIAPGVARRRRGASL